MKCKHKREMYYENRICRECVAENEEKLLAALKEVRSDINWMLNNQKLLNPEVFEYLHECIDDGPDGPALARIIKRQKMGGGL